MAGGSNVSVLAIVGQPPPRTALPRPLTYVSAGGVHAIVSPQIAPTTWTQAELEQHHALVVRLAESVHAILPVRYGTAMTQQRLRAVLGEASTDLRRALAHVTDRVQMTARIFGEAPGPEERGSGVEYLRTRQARVRLSTPAADRVRAATHELVVDERVNPGASGVPPALFHLIDRRHVEAYRRAAESVKLDGDVRIRVSGPWPPFAFAPGEWK